VASILENNQTPDGITVPEVLRPYCGFDVID
jgi:seryl-tRNA synthetase